MKPYSVVFVLLSFFMVKEMVAQKSTRNADEVLKEAYAQAQAGNKNVFLMFHASWCGWCHKLDSSLSEPSIRDFFNKNYVIAHLTVYESKDKKQLENPGAIEFLTKYKGNDLGIPYWIILDKNGKWLADSQIRSDGSDYTVQGENVGCPASREEVNHFLKVLQRTSSFNASQLALIEKRFLLNK